MFDPRQIKFGSTQSSSNCYERAGIHFQLNKFSDLYTGGRRAGAFTWSCSPTMLKLTYYFQVDMLGSRYISIIFPAPGALNGSTPQKALCGVIPGAVLEPLVRFWSHFVGIYRQKLTRSLENRHLRYPHQEPCVVTDSDSFREKEHLSSWSLPRERSNVSSDEAHSRLVDLCITQLYA